MNTLVSQYHALGLILARNRLKLYDMLVQNKRKNGRRISIRLSLVSLLATFLLLSNGPALALNDNAIPTTSSRETKAQEAKHRSCLNRAHAITNIMSHIADRGQKQLDLFTTIATRVETFYTTKGKTLSNYDVLVADVTTKQAAAQTTIDNLKISSTSFSCDSDPKAATTSFQSNLKTEIEALKAYRTAVRNLIVGVKSVQGTSASDNSQTNGGNQ